MRTIVAISTPIGVGGIGIVRMSGVKSLEFATSICENTSFCDNPRKMVLTKVNTKNFNEQALVVYFKAPYSYTGEDMIEIQCHGGVAILNGILNELIEKGASLAENGEFTKLAFLNGKMSLDEAEGVIDMITAESDAEIRAGYSLLSGKLKEKILKLQDALTECFAEIEVSLDYPEEDIEFTTSKKISTKLLDCKKEINALLETVYTGNVIKHGIDVAIMGSPNVGKSTLFNAMSNKDKAIVTSIAGTTRDLLEESITHKGIKFNLIDTAGIRQTSNEIEKIGIEKATNIISKSDIVIVVVTGNEPINMKNAQLLINKNCLLVVNKSDILSEKSFEEIVAKNVENFKKLGISFKNVLPVSALNRTNIEKLKDLIFSLSIDVNILNNSTIITSSRQAEALKNANKSIEKALMEIQKGTSLDLVNIELVDAWQFVGEITGHTNSEERINSIFDKFCLGK